MTKYVVSKDQLQRARELFDFGVLKNSVTDGAGNLCGAVGEIIVADRYNVIAGENTRDYDLIIKGKTIDIKTKRYKKYGSSNTKINLNVSAFNTGQQCDYYCFVGVDYNYEEAIIYGFIKKTDFYSRAVFRKKGEIDPNGDGVWTFKCDCWNILADKLG